MTRNDGGSAFPRPELAGQVPYGSSIEVYELHAAQDGMSMRDYFAAKALQSLIVVVSAGQHCAGASSESVAKGGRTEDKLARDAYAIADAMLKARSHD